MSNVSILFGFIFGFLALFLIFYLYIFGRIFEKMGQPKWHGWIPLYNEYSLYKEVWLGRMFFLYILSGFIYGFLILIVSEASKYYLPLYLLGIIFAIIMLIIELKYYFKISKSFGFESIMGLIGLISPFIFYCILAFSSSEYIKSEDHCSSIEL